MNVRLVRWVGAFAACLMKAKILPLAIIAAALPGMAQAAIVSGYGVEASTGTASNCPSFCTSADNGQFENDSAGGQFFTTATSTENSYGNAWAMADYSGSTTTYLPTLKTNVSSNVGKGAFATAFGVQGYSFSGANGTSITLNFDLEAEIGDNPSGYINNNVSASVAVIKTSVLDWFPDFGTLVFEVAPQNSRQGEEFILLGGDTAGLMESTSGSLTFTVDNGDDFYVVTEMNSIGKNGFVDASNSFTMSYLDDTGLTASVIPIPAAVWLFGSALGLLGWIKRKSP